MRRRIWAGCLTAAALTALVALPAVASAATIAVNTTADALVPTDGRCSLREAITAANLDIASGPAAGECRAGAGPDAIQLPAGSFDATGTGDDANAGGDFDITSAIDLVGVGNGPSGTNVRGTTDRVFDMRPGAVVTMANLWILDGHAPDGTTGGSGTTGGAGGAGSDGGGIRSAGTLTLTGVKVSNSRPGDGGAGGTATGTDGGAGANGGPALGGAGGNGGNGGGIHTTGPLTIRNSTISDNLGGAGIGGGDGLGGRGGDGVGGGGNGGNGGAGRGGDGGDAGIGGISVAGGGSLNLSGSVVTNNTAGTGGVGGSGRNGLGGAGTVNGNGGAGATNRGGDGGDGAPGGIGGTGAITVATSTVSANRASDGGPGTSGTGGAGGPGAGTGDGGDGGAALGGQGGAGGSGGAIGGSLASITASLVTGNSAGKGGNGGGASGAGGGAGSPAGVPGVGAGGAGGNGGRGGGLFASGSPNAVNVTLPDNAAGAGGAGGAAIAFGAAALGGAGGTGGSGGDAALAGGTLTHLTVTGGSVGGGGGGGTANGDVGSSPGLGGAGGAGPGILRSGGTLTVANSIFSGTSCSGTITDGGHNIDFPDSTCPGAAVRPELGPLAANGGPTQTFRLMAGSAALDSVPALGASCPLTDQRGAVRPFGAGCDAGAFEVAPPAASTGAAQGVSTTTATATGTVTPRGLATSSRVEFGETTAYGQAADAGSTASPVPVGVTAALAGLKPATTYHYRLVAQSPDGQAIGGDATFVTAAATAAGTPRPTLSALGVSPNRFAVAKGATALSARAVPRGTTISYRLSAKAAVRLSMQQAGKGVKVRRRGNTTCVPAGARRFKRAAKRLRCTAFTVRGTLTRAGAAGANRVRFSGRIGKRALKLGGYRVVASATNAGGRSNDATKAFRIVPFRR